LAGSARYKVCTTLHRNVVISARFTHHPIAFPSLDDFYGLLARRRLLPSEELPALARRRRTANNQEDLTPQGV
jgi:hypothetical protein